MHYNLTIFLLEKKSYIYFIGYLYDDYKIKSLHIMVPKASAYVKSYDGQNIEDKDDNLLEKYKTIWDKISPDIIKKLHREPVNNKIFPKPK